MKRAGFVLTGGLSSRMGRDKALLPWGHGTLVQHISDGVVRVTGSVILIGHPERYAHLNLACVGDLRPGYGPLSGIETALTHSAAPWNLIVACDLPGISTALLAKLFERAEQGGAEVVAARDVSGKRQPLCAVYHTSCLGRVQSALDARELRLMSLVESMKTEYVDTDMLITNINKPEEWISALPR